MLGGRPCSRRIAVSVLVALGIRLGSRAVAGQDTETLDGGQPAGSAEIPTTGGRRPGPVEIARVAGGPRLPPGITPVVIQVEKAAIDAPIERVAIVDGVMQNPSGPWVVSWYEDLAGLGEGSNAVMAGHVDYWDVGPAVFWNLAQLVPGDRLRVAGEDDRVFEYAMDWMRNYVVTEMTATDLDEIVGPTDAESLTLITCAIGTWDPERQEYRERSVLRATQVA